MILPPATELLIEVDTRIAWDAEQDKPRAKRRTYAQVEAAIRDIYEGRNPYVTVESAEAIDG